MDEDQKRLLSINKEFVGFGAFVTLKFCQLSHHNFDFIESMMNIIYLLNINIQL